MAEEKADRSSKKDVVHLVAEQHTGDEIGLGMSVKADKSEFVELREGMSVKTTPKSISGQGRPQASASPPPKPSDAATSAKPPPKDSDA
jgi:hypothetical protein